jgi:hypothetical protein
VDEQHEPVGSVAEEAAKLVDALRGWAADLGHGAPGAAAATEPTTETAAGATTGTANGATTGTAPGEQHERTQPCGECRACPICRGLGLVRALSPEVKSHLATAGTLFLQNLAEAMDATAPRAGHRPPPAGPAGDD